MLAQAAGFLVFVIGYVGALLLVVRGAVRGAHTIGDVVLAVVARGADEPARVRRRHGSMQWLLRAVDGRRPDASMRALLAELYRRRARADCAGPGTDRATASRSRA